MGIQKSEANTGVSYSEESQSKGPEILLSQPVALLISDFPGIKSTTVVTQQAVDYQWSNQLESAFLDIWPAGFCFLLVGKMGRSMQPQSEFGKVYLLLLPSAFLLFLRRRSKMGSKQLKSSWRWYANFLQDHSRFVSAAGWATYPLSFSSVFGWHRWPGNHLQAILGEASLLLCHWLG